MNQVKVGNRVVNFAGALPLTLGEWEALEAKGASLKEVATGRLTPIIELAAFVLQKVDATVTPAEVRAMTRADAVVVLNAVLASEGGSPNRPSSSLSTDSQ